jgi:Na+/proline symporter
MATHGTDQDMVQRLLTAPDPRRSKLSLILSGIADIPIALAFLGVGILLALYYAGPGGGVPNIPDNEIFAHFIVHDLPTGLRGLIIAGVFATMMGSTSAALNALATSFTSDFYLPYVNPAADDRATVRAARITTLVFGMLMVVVGTMAAYSVLHDPRLTIIPIAIGILGYTYGSLLGIFLLGMLTNNRGNDRMNVFAMLGGIFAVLILGRVHLPGIVDFGLWMPSWWPVIAWPWYVLIGCTATILLAIPFRQGPILSPAKGVKKSGQGFSSIL